MIAIQKFPECDDCINQELDPYQCETCEDACNFEPDGDDVENLTYHEFIAWYNEEGV